MATLLQDSFTDTDYTLLEDHTPDIGTPWEVVSSATWIVSEKARKPGTVYSNVGSHTDISIEALISTPSTTNYAVYFFLRGDAMPLTTCYYMKLYRVAGDWQFSIWKKLVGVDTQLAIETSMTTPGESIMKFEVIGSALTISRFNGLTYDIEVSATDSAIASGNWIAFQLAGTSMIIDDFLCQTPASPITIITTSLPNGLIDNFYTQSLHASGDISYTWSLDSGTLPDGLALVNGFLYGYPTTAGLYTFTLQAIGDVGGGIDTQTYTISIGDKFNASEGGGINVAILGKQDENVQRQLANIIGQEYGRGFKIVTVDFNADGAIAQVDAGFKVTRWKVVDISNVPVSQYIEVKQTAVDDRFLTLQSVGASGQVKLHLWG